jgi:predicted nuclease of predicted toxin-antitoxin system
MQCGAGQKPRGCFEALGLALMIRLLIDECLSPLLAAEAHVRGLEAHHVTRFGLQSKSDRSLMPQIIGGDFTFVTNNAKDFLRLYRSVDVHAGLLLILPSVGNAEQRRLFGVALDAIIVAGSDITGELIEVDRDGTVRFRRYPDPLGND